MIDPITPLLTAICCDTYRGVSRAEGSVHGPHRLDLILIVSCSTSRPSWYPWDGRTCFGHDLHDVRVIEVGQ
jgi:hypothetical protein